jgi:hypothetical protein
MNVPQAEQREKNVPPDERVLWSEVISAKACSVSVPTFRSWVRLGLIDRVPLPGGLRRNLYRRADVEALPDRLARRA